MKHATTICGLLALFLLGSLAPTLALAQDPGLPSGNGVQPVLVAGNPHCVSPFGLGYAFGFKPQPEPPPSGTYTTSDGYLTVTITTDGTFFDWNSNRGVDAVIVKGGPNSDVFVYDPPAESKDDTGLHAPINPNDPNNKPYAISHIEFCYDIELGVTKDAETSYKRTWEWEIVKTADQTELVLAQGQTFTVNYTVNVTATFTDSDHAVSGTIEITNPHPTATATITSISDVISPNIAATVTCPSLTVPPGGSLQCTYSAALPDGSNRTNTVTVTSTGVPGNSATAAVAFGDPTTEIDACVDVTDTVAGVLGQVCASLGTQSGQFNYPVDLIFTSSEDCGQINVQNVASFTTESGATGQDDHTILVNVVCEEGCTLTQGYWKTHSQRGPAPYDDNWANLGPAQENTTFFLSGQSYYGVLWTPPAGNVYYILAHQYIAARLNMLNGASVPAAVQTAFNTATGLFTTTTPAQAAALKGAARQVWTNLALILADYNQGVTGPGHCSEETSAAARLSGGPAVEVAAEAGVAAEEVPGTFRLGQNYPNPFNPSTTIRLELPEAAPVTLVVYDVLGRQVARLVDGTLEAGSHAITWDASGLPSGAYLFVARAGAWTQTRNMILMK